MPAEMSLKVRRALLSVSDKTGIVELARALKDSGAELIATGNTAEIIKAAGISITPIEKVSGCPEAFQGRMKTLSFPVFSGILHRRGDSAAAQKDLSDLKTLGFGPIDAVVVNFYPFEKAALTPGISKVDLIEQIDIGGPALVRAAAKNAPSVLVLTDPAQYAEVISDLSKTKAVTEGIVNRASSEAWNKVLTYDQAIAEKLAESNDQITLRYGENPHQTGQLKLSVNSPIDWKHSLGTPLSYNNILDVSSAFGLACDLVRETHSSCVIVKHNNPCGVAFVPKRSHDQGEALLKALELAWAGDPISAFGGVVVMSGPLTEAIARFFEGKFVEVIAAPEMLEGTNPNSIFTKMTAKKKNLRGLHIRRFDSVPVRSEVQVPGGVLVQSTDLGLNEELRTVTKASLTEGKRDLALFGIAVNRALKSNAVALVREVEGAFQLVGCGQGQPNRVEALKWLALPRAARVLEGGSLEECILVSDAFFPFRDTVDEAFAGGVRTIVQPGGSMRDQESIDACNEHGIVMAFTGKRHFRH